MEELILGVDLGTNFSSAAAWVNGRQWWVTDEQSDIYIPSLIYIPEAGPPVVGARAEQLAQAQPHRLIRGIKRILGRSPDDPQAALFGAQNSAAVRRTPGGGILLQLGGKDLTPVELAAWLFRYIKARAELRFGPRVKKVVLGHPAGAPGAVQQTLTRAATLAELEVVGLLPEPTAAAAALGLDDFHGKRWVMIYDFGGGTLDVTLLSQQDGRLTPRAVGGDDSLGGDDLDLAVAQLAEDTFWRWRGLKLSTDQVRWRRVLGQAERVKRALSVATECHLKVTELFTPPGPTDLDLLVTRAQAEERFRPLVERSLQVAADAMVSAGLRPRDLERVVMVGGTTFVPLVQQRLSQVMGRIEPAPDPRGAVATGLAKWVSVRERFT